MFKSRIKSNIRMVINLRCNVKVSKSWWYQITHTNYYSSSKLFSLLYGHKKNIYHYVVKMIHIWDSSYNFVFSSLWSFKKMSKLKKTSLTTLWRSNWNPKNPTRLTLLREQMHSPAYEEETGRPPFIAWFTRHQRMASPSPTSPPS